MSVIITWGIDQLEVDAVLGYEWTRPTRTVVHPILANRVPVITLREAGSRQGTLSLFFATKAAALDAEDAHTLADVFSISDTAHPDLAMRYVVGNGDLHLTQDTETMRRWVLEVPFQEVGS